MIDKIVKTEIITDFDINRLDGSLEEIIEYLEGFKDEKYSKISLRTTLGDDGDGPFGYIEVVGSRLETDIELNQRIELKAKQELQKILKAQEDAFKEKELYKQLKEKYEKTNESKS